MYRMMAEREFDIVILGANGYAGRYLVWELARTLRREGDGATAIRWAIAGRSMSKLVQTLRNACDVTDEDLSKISVIRADVSDPGSLERMAARTRILLNCVGPFRFYGEQVIKSCVAMGTHYLDISGEPGFMDSTFLTYDSSARSNNVYVVNSCGWDTIPTDLAVLYMQQNVPGELAWIESYTSFSHTKKGAWLNFATFQSAIYSISNYFADQGLHRQIMDNSIPKPKYKIPWRFPIFYNWTLGDYCMLLPDSEQCIVERTQRYNYQQHKMRPVQFNSYFQPGSLWRLCFFVVLATVFGLLSLFKFGRHLMERHPMILSGGIFRKGGPKDEQVASSSFSTTFIGRGWASKVTDEEEEEGEHTQPPNVTYKARVKGPEFAYVTTSICMIQSAYTLLKEQHKLAQPGVHTPASLFAGSTLMERLRQRGITFSML